MRYLLAAAAALSTGFGFLPPQVGNSTTYRYEATEQASPASITVEAAVTITRISPDEIGIVVTPGSGARSAFTAMLGADGALQSIVAVATPAPSVTPSPRPAPGHRGQGETPWPTATPVPLHVPPRIPEPITETASLLATAAAVAEFPATWTHVLSTNGVPLTMSVARSVNGNTTTFIADGNNTGNTLRIEATVRDNVFAGARGTLKFVTSDMDQRRATTLVWSLSP